MRLIRGKVNRPDIRKLGWFAIDFRERGFDVYLGDRIWYFRFYPNVKVGTHS